MKLTELHEKFEEKHMKNLKYCRLNIEICICTESNIENVSLWDLIALKEPRIVLRGHNVLLRSLESLMCNVHCVR